MEHVPYRAPIERGPRLLFPERLPATVRVGLQVAVANEGSVGEQRGPRLERQHPELEPEPVDDLLVEQVDGVGAGREREARDELLRGDGAARGVAALEHDHVEAFGGEDGGRGESVVAGADDDGVRHRGGAAARRGGSARPRARAGGTG